MCGRFKDARVGFGEGRRGEVEGKLWLRLDGMSIAISVHLLDLCAWKMLNMNNIIKIRI